MSARDFMQRFVPQIPLRAPLQFPAPERRFEIVVPVTAASVEDALATAGALALHAHVEISAVRLQEVVL